MPPKPRTPAPAQEVVFGISGDKWIWEEESPMFGGGGGALARLFRAEEFSKPGVLDLDPPSNEAALFARETIQNSWDAAREWRRECGKRGKPIPPFEMEFDFLDIPNKDRIQFIDAMGLDEHSRLVMNEKGREKARQQDFDLANDALLTNILANKHPLRLLRVVERAGLGMPGNFENNKSRMTRALLRLGKANVEAGAGGAFGYGKAGLIQASAVRVIFAYSAFKEVADDPGITRRLMGVTYWKDHTRGVNVLTGWARFGEPIRFKLVHDGIEKIVTSAMPFTNEVADRHAASLGIDARSPKDVLQTGTTFLLVDPTITASDLRKAVERYWWPAMLDPLEPLKVRIRDYDGADLSPTVPRGDEHMADFIRAYQIASNAPAPQNANEQRLDFGKSKAANGNHYELGRLAMVADPSGWSFPDKSSGGQSIDHRSMIALIRGPKMVVDYRTFNRIGTPHIRGVFIADQEVDDLLRQTENPAHTKWDSTVKTPDNAAGSIAKAVLDTIRSSLVEFQSKFAPPAPKPDDRSLPILEDLSRLMRGKRIAPPTPAPRQVLIAITEAAHAKLHDTSLKCEAKVKFRIADWVWDAIDETEVKVAVSLTIAYVEDGGLGGKLEVTATPSNRKFTSKGKRSGVAIFHGQLGVDDEVAFSIVSEKYSPDWTVRFVPEAEILEPQVKSTKPKKVTGKG